MFLQSRYVKKLLPPFKGIIELVATLERATVPEIPFISSQMAPDGGEAPSRGRKKGSPVLENPPSTCGIQNVPRGEGAPSSGKLTLFRLPCPRPLHPSPGEGSRGGTPYNRRISEG